jgi:hypothetical protein
VLFLAQEESYFGVSFNSLPSSVIT